MKELHLGSSVFRGVESKNCDIVLKSGCCGLLVTDRSAPVVEDGVRRGLLCERKNDNEECE